MVRLDKERQQELEPQRINFAVQKLSEIGIEVTSKDSTKITFDWQGSKITFFPYSGWHTGKGIKDGRGINNLLKQLKTH